MPSDHDRELDRQLRAFGATLEQRTHEPIGPAAGRALAQDPSPNRRVWVLLTAAACVVALVAGLVLLGGGDEPSQGAASPGAQATTVQAPPGSLAWIDDGGSPSFEPLVGVGAVVEATVVGHLGPIAELNDFGAVDYPGRPDDAAEWTTPSGLPVLVLDDLAIVEVIGGSAPSDAVAQRLQDAVAAGDDIEVLAPVGVFAQGERYQLWISDWNQPTATVTYLTYLAFDAAGEPVPGLGRPGLDAAIDVLVAHTGDTVVASLAALAREINAVVAGAPQGPLMDAMNGPFVPVSGPPPVSTAPPAAGSLATAPPTTGDAASLAARTPADAIGLEPSGWTLADRSEGWLIIQPAVDDVLACDAYSQLAGLMDVPTVRDAYAGPAGELLSVTYVELGRESTAGALVAGIGGLDGCPEPGGVLDPDGAVPADEPVIAYDGGGVGAVGWSVGGTHAVVAVVPADGSLDVGVLIAVSGADPASLDGILDTAVGLAAAYVGVPASVAPDTTGIVVTEGREPDIADEALVLMVSNQSFEDDPVGLTIEIDGVPVADGRYDVGSQHTVTYYVVRGLAPGSHRLSVVADTGVELQRTVRTNEGRPRWAYLTYWYYPDDPAGRFLDVMESDEAIAID